MTEDYMNELVALGFTDEENMAAQVTFTDGDGAAKNGVLCVNGDIVTLATGEPPKKLFSDSIDRLKNIRVKSGLFKKAICFSHNGVEYEFDVKGGKKLLPYFKLLAEE